ncbi:MAG: NIL domain-containing protein [Candidatus Omnitrophica bacterium]|nr:NIL domain-containing protein [Candidatus Omnitrophota bacterium]MDD5775192.1 NIL domain-containing protein [Candidatus Omnitrophota bacterium]
MKIKTELIFPGKLKDQPVMCEACKKYDMLMTIHEASFSKDTGWAFVTLSGSKDDIVKGMAYLKKSGVVVRKSLNFI